MSGNEQPTSAPWERALIEKLATASLREQRAARRWKVLVRLLWLALLGVLAWWLIAETQVEVVPTGPHTAVVAINGEIASDTLASAQAINSGLREAFETEDAQAVVVVINSPGGSPVQAGLVYDEMRRLRDLHDKPLYVVCEEMCASAAYYLAAAADQIIVNRASLVGSIGVLMDGFGFTGLMDKLGVERRLMTAGQHKAEMDPFSPQSPEQKAHLQAMLSDIHAQFIDAVKTGRGDRLKAEADLFSGRVWTGAQAVQLGLADGLGSLEQVAREVVGTDTWVDYSLHESVAERLANRLGAQIQTMWAAQRQWRWH